MGRTATTRLRLAFMGTPDFSVPVLRALADAGHEIACVYSQPPRPAKRGQKPQPSPVQRFAEERDWPFRSPVRLRDAEAQSAFADLALDAAVVVAYGLILPTEILTAPRLGCLNVHASLLPRWRGAAPIQRAILAGDSETGVTIMQMDAGLDTGPSLLREAVPIGPQTTAADLHDGLAALGARLIIPALDGLEAGQLAPTPQPEDGITYAAKLTREEGRLDWRQAAGLLERQVRAFTPWPGAFLTLPEKDGRAAKADERMKVLSASVVTDAPAAEPGTVVDGSLTVACGDGALRLLRVQRPGRAAMSAEELLRGFALPAGTCLPRPELGESGAR